MRLELRTGDDLSAGDEPEAVDADGDGKLSKEELGRLIGGCRGRLPRSPTMFWLFGALFANKLTPDNYQKLSFVSCRP